MALIIGFKLQCTKSIIIYEHINLLSSLDLESLWPDVDGGRLASAMRNNFCICIFDFPHVSARMPHTGGPAMESLSFMVKDFMMLVILSR